MIVATQLTGDSLMLVMAVSRRESWLIFDGQRRFGETRVALGSNASVARKHMQIPVSLGTSLLAMDPGLY